MCDDAVVHDDDLSGAVAVRMGVFLGRAAMGGPTRVADAVGALDGRFLQGFFQIAQLARSATDFELAVLGDHSDSGGIVAAGFQLAQALNDHGHSFFRSDVTDNSTHGTMAPGNASLKRNTEFLGATNRRGSRCGAALRTIRGVMDVFVAVLFADRACYAVS